MAERESAAALSFLVYVVLSTFFCSCRADFVCSRQDIIDIGWKCKVDITGDFQKVHNIPDAIGRPAESLWICCPIKRHRRRRERRQKHGRRSGILARLKRASSVLQALAQGPRTHYPPLLYESLKGPHSRALCFLLRTEGNHICSLWNTCVPFYHCEQNTVLCGSRSQMAQKKIPKVTEKRDMLLLKGVQQPK